MILSQRHYFSLLILLFMCPFIELQTAKGMPIFGSNKDEAQKSREKEIEEILDTKQSDLRFIIRDRFTYRKGTNKDLAKSPFLFITNGELLEEEALVPFNNFISEILNRSEKHIVFYIHGWGVSPEKAVKQAKSMQWIVESDYFQKDGIKDRDILVIPIIWGTTVNPAWKILPGYPKDTLKRAKNSSGVIANLFNSLADYQSAIESDLSYFDEDSEEVQSEYEIAAVEKMKSKLEKKFHIIAHSMGNRTLKHIIRKMNEFRPGWGTFSSIHSVAADISLDKMKSLDGELFKESLGKVENQNENIFVYFSKIDRALSGSRVVRVLGLKPQIRLRLGSYADELEINGIKVIDCTEVSEKDDPDRMHSYLLRRVSVAKEKDIEHRHTSTLQYILQNIRFRGINEVEDLNDCTPDEFENFLKRSGE